MKNRMTCVSNVFMSADLSVILASLYRVCVCNFSKRTRPRDVLCLLKDTSIEDTKIVQGMQGCQDIVFIHCVQMGGQEKVCPGSVSETIMYKKLILGRDIG